MYYTILQHIFSRNNIYFDINIDKTGTEAGFLQIGQEFTDGHSIRRKATFADVKAAAGCIAKSNGDSVYDDAIKKHGRKPDRDFPMPEPE